jgi:hypothetical protein
VFQAFLAGVSALVGVPALVSVPASVLCCLLAVVGFPDISDVPAVAGDPDVPVALLLL